MPPALSAIMGNHCQDCGLHHMYARVPGIRWNLFFFLLRHIMIKHILIAKYNGCRKMTPSTFKLLPYWSLVFSVQLPLSWKKWRLNLLLKELHPQLSNQNRGQDLWKLETARERAVQTEEAKRESDQKRKEQWREISPCVEKLCFHFKEWATYKSLEV